MFFLNRLAGSSMQNGVTAIFKKNLLHSRSVHVKSEIKNKVLWKKNLKFFAIGSFTIGPVLYYQTLDSAQKRQVNVTVSGIGRFFRFVLFIYILLFPNCLFLFYKNLSMYYRNHSTKSIDKQLCYNLRYLRLS